MKKMTTCSVWVYATYFFFIVNCFVEYDQDWGGAPPKEILPNISSIFFIYKFEKGIKLWKIIKCWLL